MSKHTPGSWTAVADSGEEGEDDGWYVLNDKEAAIAVGLYGPDAHLIAAAPDMLKALKTIARCGSIDDDWLVPVRAAIAKAEGAS